MQKNVIHNWTYVISPLVVALIYLFSKKLSTGMLPPDGIVPKWRWAV
jgi:hypothetical protein